MIIEKLEQTENMYECEKIQERITRLVSGVAIIRVGAATEVEMIEKKHRIEDALAAVSAAQLEGIVPGGGIALIRASKNLNIKVLKLILFTVEGVFLECKKLISTFFFLISRFLLKNSDNS